MIETKIKCDQCGAVRAGTNKWFILSVGADIRISGFTEKKARRKNNISLCGENCLHLYVSPLLAGLHETETPTEIPENGKEKICPTAEN